MKEVWSSRGEWVLPGDRRYSAWTSRGSREGEWAYFWVSVPFDEHELRRRTRVYPEVWYRVSPIDGPEAGWEQMAPSDVVFSKTGFVPTSPDDPFATVLGGAKKLSAGTYRLDLRVECDGESILLKGMTSRVGSWQIRPGETTRTEIPREEADLHAIVQVLRRWSEDERLIERALSLYREQAEKQADWYAEKLRGVKPEFEEQYLVFRASLEWEDGPYVITRLTLSVYDGLDSCGSFELMTPIHDAGRSTTSLTVDFDKLPEGRADYGPEPRSDRSGDE